MKKKKELKSTILTLHLMELEKEKKLNPKLTEGR